ncbi:MAG: PAS domain S-box protein [Chlorobiaceae bacterium]|nr:PAS domain S-box protein [Chlorobiaceae bacterium]
MHTNSDGTQNQRENTYRIIFDESSEPAFIIDRAGTILDANKAFASLFSEQFTDCADCLGLNVFSLLDTNLAEERRKHIDHAFRNGKRMFFEDERNGRFFRNTLYPIPGKDGITEKIYMLAQDITETKYSESKSRKQSAFSREAMEAIPGPFVVLDPRGSIITSNSHFRKIIARNEDDDLSGLNSLDLFHPDDRAFAYEKLDNILQKGTEEIGEIRIMVNGGPEFRWFRIQTKRIFVDNEMFLVSTGNDIDKYKKKEEELSISNDQLRFILSQSKTGSWEWDTKTKTNKWTDEMWLLYGLEKNAFEPTHDNWRKLLIEEDRDTVEQQIVEKIVKGIPFRLEVRTYHSDGSLHWLLIRAFPFKDIYGSITHYVGIVIDITDLKESEQKLKESEERFRRLFQEHASVMLVVDDETGKILYANKAAEDFYGWSSKELCSMSIERLSSSSPDTIRKEKEAIKSLGLRKLTSVHRKADGSLRDVEVFCTPDILGERPVYYSIINDVTDRKLAEIQLIDSKSKLEAALESMNDAVIISDPDGRFIELNNAFATFHRFTCKDECLKVLADYPKILEVFKSDGTPAPLEEWAVTRALRGETGIAVEYGLQRRDTGEKWVGSYNFAPIRDKEGDITGSVVTARDITRIKMADEALRESEERFRKFFEQHSAVMILFDQETGDILDANVAAEKFYGWRQEKLKGMNIKDIITNPPDVSQRAFEGFNNVEKRNFVTTHTIADGSCRDVEVFSHKIRVRDRWFVYSIIHDITERKLAEKELKRLSVAIHQSPVVVAITDSLGNIEYINPTFTKLTGYTFEEVKGKNSRILQSGLMPKELYENLWKTILSGKVWHGEFHNRKKNGELYWEDAFISAITDEKGTITSFVAVKEDITEKKKLWNELVAAKDKAEESDRLKTAFLANMSHEIRTPMNGIIGFTELLKEPHLTGQEQQEYIELIQQSGERMMNLINVIIEISRIDAKETVIELSETPLNELLERLYRSFIPKAENKGLQLNWNPGLSDHESTIETDAEKLEQIMTNLIQNALKFTHHGHITFGYTKKDDMLEFYVDDTGVGIPEDMKEKIFDRFRQVDNSLSRLHEGIGLGLSITKTYIEMLGGGIHVEPCKCGGSKFFFTLPYNPPRKNDIGLSGSEVMAITQPPQTIIIAEDDKISSLLLKKVLKDENFMLIFAENGKDALELVKKHPETELVLMDVKMPDMNGYEATRLIKQIRPELPVIVLTAFASPEKREKASDAGCDSFITKPVKKNELIELIRTMMGK